MEISVIGTGYVGLTSAIGLAELGHNVNCIDINDEIIKKLKNLEINFYEPGLQELLNRNYKDKRIKFSTDCSLISNSDIIFLCVGTPAQEDGSTNLEYIFSAAESIKEFLKDDAIVAVKSTVPVGTCYKVRDIIQSTKKNFHIVSNPEFLKEGDAVNDFLKPDRIVVGCESKFALDQMKELYMNLFCKAKRIISMSITSSELTKYASNSFLATKISFINEIANLCSSVNASIDDVRKGMCSDHRIGDQFLFPGIGYGGSCFPKDVLSLIHTAKENNVSLNTIEGGYKTNQKQKTLLFEKFSEYLKDKKLSAKVVTFLGVSFKPKTDDVRESPSIFLAQKLIETGVKINIHDPEGSQNFKKLFSKNQKDITIFDSPYEALKNSDALFLLTEWNQYRNLDYKIVSENMNGKLVLDGRNVIYMNNVLKNKLDYISIGRVLEDETRAF